MIFNTRFVQSPSVCIIPAMLLSANLAEFKYALKKIKAFLSSSILKTVSIEVWYCRLVFGLDSE